ncbi:hypothetical protein AAFC00_006898 [Neodothiora populina]|uniref:18S rRNA factor 2 n=1 Tax=Neodothiora populina TaxID=2781224 RepID=A0ABR3PBI6_9PEZI
MTTRKRNEWLDTGVSDDEDDQAQNDSDDQQESRGALTGRSAKRRRVNQEDNGSEDESGDEEETSAKDTTRSRSKFTLNESDAASDDDVDVNGQQHASDDEHGDQPPATGSRSDLTKEPKIKPLSAKQVDKARRAAKKTGVIYLSRIPPFMKPATLKHLLESYGEIGRIFLTPEDHAQHQRRVKSGGNKKKSFTDGWVEFKSKKTAKIVAETLNGSIVGGKKGNFYHDDVWNMKYLKGFKWSHLTEQIANENAERAARLRAEISKTRRENKKFVEDVERAKMLETMQAKRKAREEKEAAAGNSEDGHQATTSATSTQNKTRERPGLQFKQNQVKSKKAKDGAKADQPELVNRVLKTIF